MKRPRDGSDLDSDSEYQTEPKKYKTNQPINIWDKFITISPPKTYKKTYVSGTDVKNYLLNDPLLDWFDLYYDKTNLNLTKPNLLFDKGNEFESEIFEKLKKKFVNKTIMINTQGKSGYTQHNYKKTINHMKKGTPFIFQGVLINDSNSTIGMADIICRSDYVNLITKHETISPEQMYIPGPKLAKISPKYHYVIIDIKWTTMSLCVGSSIIRNDGRFPAYKGQLAIYTCAIGAIQGYIPTQAYILAKSWICHKKDNITMGYDCFEKLGVIDYANSDNKYINQTVNAIKWVIKVRNEGLTWNIYKPHIKELYPNCSNHYDAPWTNIKQTIAKQIKDPTLIWNVSYKNRNMLLDKNIKSWTNIKCTAKNLSICGDSTAHIIDSILNINRNKNKKILVQPKKIVNNLFNWKTKTKYDYYVDFETINKNISDTELSLENCRAISDMVFMIGVGYEIKTKWYFKTFVTKDLSIQEETRIFNDFFNFILGLRKKSNMNDQTKSRLFHWTQAETNNFKHVNLRNNLIYNKFTNVIEWVDMYKIFVKEPIVIKGCFNFKLKSIGKALFNHKLIKTNWDESGPEDGFDAMMGAIDYYTNINTNTQSMNTIIKYNEIDCKILWEIMDYIRTIHL